MGAGIDTLVTTEKMQKRCPNLPQTPTVLDIKDELQALPKAAIGLRIGLLKILPAGLAAGFFNVPRRGDRREAALIFTSGSSGEPKGVVLSKTIPSKLFSPIDGEVFVVHCSTRRGDSTDAELVTIIFIEMR